VNDGLLTVENRSATTSTYRALAGIIAHHPMNAVRAGCLGSNPLTFFWHHGLGQNVRPDPEAGLQTQKEIWRPLTAETRHERVHLS
jgi:hypothetical protein